MLMANVKDEKEDIKIKSKENINGIYLVTNNELKVAKQYHKRKVRGQLIEKIASELFYVDYKSNIKDLIDDFNILNTTKVIAVVDEENNNRIFGIIERKKIFNILSKPFGRDILFKEKIEDIMKNEVLKEIITEIPYFYVEKNIFSVASDIQDSLESKETLYFFVVKDNKEFAGIFTNIDILFYLSSITQEDLKTAKQIQNNIVKEKLIIKEKKFTLVAGSSMAKGIGGDFYFIENIHNSDKWIMTICDVSGKGVSAALITAVLGGLFNIYNFSNRLLDFLIELNSYMLSTFNMEKYLTGIFLKFDANNGRVKLFDMGHSYVYIYKNKSLYKFKSFEENVPIGFISKIEPKSNHFKLQKDDILIALTDGILEQPNSAGTQYGLNRIIKLIEKNKKNNFDKLINIIFDDIKEFRGFHPQHDDITILILQYKD